MNAWFTMKTGRKLLPLALIVLGCLVTLVVFFMLNRPFPADASSGYLTNAESTYPNIKGTKLNSCNLCHTASIPALNAYGSDFMMNSHNFSAIASLDSDKDGFTNIQEINALTYPGDANDHPASAPTATSTNTKPAVPTATNTKTAVPTATSTKTTVPTATSTKTALPTEISTNTAVPTATNPGTAVPSATGTTPAGTTDTPTDTPVASETTTDTPAATATEENTATQVPTITDTPGEPPTETATKPPAATPSEEVTETTEPTRRATQVASPTNEPTDGEEDSEPTRPAVTTSPRPSGDSRINASADTYVEQHSPDNNFGSDHLLRADNSPLRRSYLRFDIPDNLQGAVETATLQLYVNFERGSGFTIHAVNGATWNENQITFVNAPAIAADDQLSLAVHNLHAGQWVSVDITYLVQGQSSVDLALVANQGAWNSFASRESGEHAPILILNTSGGSSRNEHEGNGGNGENGNSGHGNSYKRRSQTTQD